MQIEPAPIRSATAGVLHAGAETSPPEHQLGLATQHERLRPVRAGAPTPPADLSCYDVRLATTHPRMRARNLGLSSDPSHVSRRDTPVKSTNGAAKTTV